MRLGGGGEGGGESRWGFVASRQEGAKGRSARGCTSSHVSTVAKKAILAWPSPAQAWEAKRGSHGEVPIRSPFSPSPDISSVVVSVALEATTTRTQTLLTQSSLPLSSHLSSPLHHRCLPLPSNLRHQHHRCFLSLTLPCFLALPIRRCVFRFVSA